MKIVCILLASCLPTFAEEEAFPKLPDLWHAIVPSPYVETSYLRELMTPRKSAIFRDIGKTPMQQSPHHGHITIDGSSTIWSSDLQISEFFLQSKIALETLDFNF